VNYVGVPLRALALAVDGVALGALAVILALVLGDARAASDPGSSSAGITLPGPVLALWFALSFVYFVAFEARLGATPGKLLVGMRVRSAGGGPVSLRQASVRTALRLVDGLGLYAVAAVAVLASPAAQRLGDRAAGTVVVRHLSQTATVTDLPARRRSERPARRAA
jgi:uncharacterized RDD family membrane protein YckC